MADLAQILTQALGHEFTDPAILEKALRHSSSDAVQQLGSASNERLEFLGDRVLGLVIAQNLLERNPGENEGEISRRHAELVRSETLAKVAKTINLGASIDMAKGETDNGGCANPSILANAMEAVIAALYLDGGLSAADKFIRANWADMMDQTPTPPKDAKTGLQEWAQGRGLALPEYRETDREGPAHAPNFTVEVRVDGFAPATGIGASKRAAEQSAAENLLGQLSNANG
ncbi:MAG: ribonuclease III [Rhodospirillales bacterium]|nr:ribonuclease III [Rhodospirillales bacterium]